MAMRRYALVFGLIGLLATVPRPAQAGSGEPWTGFYGGAHVGYGWADISGWDTLFDTGIGSATARGWTFGGQLGYDRQCGTWVWGAQASLAKAELTGSHTYIDGTGPSDQVSYDIKYLGTLTGRIGFPVMPDTLAYLKGGGSWTKINHDDSDPAPLFGAPYTGSKQVGRLGWILGLGLEHRIGRNLSSFVEYQHMDFGRDDITIAYSDGLIADYSFKQRLDYVVLGLNYRF